MRKLAVIAMLPMAIGCGHIRGDVGTIRHAESCSRLAKSIILLEEDARDQGVSSSCFGGGYSTGSGSRYGNYASVAIASLDSSSCSSSSNATGAMKKRRKLMWIYNDGKCPVGLIDDLRAQSE